MIANRVVDCGEGIVINTNGVISGNLLANNSSNGLRILGSPTVVSNTIVFNGSAGVVIDSGGPPVLHHNNLVASAGEYALRNNTANAIDATDNWWGTTDDAAIQAAIYDGNDEFGYGVVNYSGYLSDPEQDAPAYVRSVTVLPDTTLGIQTATFDVYFSRAMDDGPVMTFYTARRGSWQRFNQSNSGLVDDNVRAIVIDQYGNRWFGVWGGVVVWRTDDSWEVFLPGATVYNLTLDRDGTTIWVGTNGMGTYALSSDGTVLEHYPDPQQVMDVFIDNQGNKWIASWGQGLYLLRSNGTWERYDTSNSGLANDLAYTVAVDKSGNVWCGFGDAGNIGVSQLKADGTWSTYTTWNSGLADNHVRTIAVDEEGNIWFGGAGDVEGLSVLRTNGTWENYAIYDGYAIAFIDDEVWVGEHRGVAILRDGVIDRIPAVMDPSLDGLPYDTVHDIVVDSERNIWFATCCSIDPPGGAALLWRGLDYGMEDGMFTAPTSWRVIYDVTSLIPRDTYTLSISRAKGTDGIEIPRDTRFGFTVDYAGEVTDETPPPPPSVSAHGNESDPSYVEATWSASDPDSPITGYRYAIGSAPSATDIVNWTTTSNTWMSRSGLGLVEGRVYWVSVQARNTGGLWSASGYGLFFAGQPPHKVVLPVVFKNH